MDLAPLRNVEAKSSLDKSTKSESDDCLPAEDPIETVSMKNPPFVIERKGTHPLNEECNDENPNPI